jgi:hypothetical protein
VPKFHRQLNSSPRFRYGVSFATWFALLSILAFIGVAIGFTVKFLIDGNKIGLDTASANFAFYKNSRFQECRDQEQPDDPGTCPDVRANLMDLSSGMFDDFAKHGISVVTMPYIVSKNRTSSGAPVTYSWCEAVSCLDSSFKVVPSAPRSSVFTGTFLTVWSAIAITLFTTLLDFRQRNGAKFMDWGQVIQWRQANKVDEACKALREVAWYEWGLHAYGLGSFVWWWISFGRFVASPAYNSPPGTIGWVVPWKYAVLVLYHPYSCATADKRRPRHLAWVFNTLAFVQWAGTVYVLHVDWSRIALSHLPFQSYDCATTLTDEAPGVSSCSTQQLCDNSWLLTHPIFTYRDEVMAANMLGLIFFIVFTVAAIFPTVTVCLGFLFEVVSGKPLSMRLFKEIRREGKLSPTVVLGVAAFGSAIAFGTGFMANVIRMNGYGQEAPLAIDPVCNAVHIALSPWRSYFDVDGYQKVTRIAKMWFNA